MAQKLSGEQERFLRWLRRGEGRSQPKYATKGFFSKSTIESLIKRGLVIDDWAKGYFTATEEGGLRW